MADLVQVTSPSGVRFTVNRDAAAAFAGFLADLEGGGYRITQSESGGYNPRFIAGTTVPSQHSYGHAIDINWQQNPQGGGTSDLPPDIDFLAAEHGLTWGGVWSGKTRDPMHFEYRADRMKPADFVTTYGPLAGDIADATGLDANTVLGQMAQETGWGSRINGNNPFGISPGGKLASYSSLPEGAQAYVDLINRKYQVAALGATPGDQAKIVTGLGYNSADPNYAARVSANAERIRGLRDAAEKAPSDETLLTRMQQLSAPPSQPQPTETAPSGEDLLTRMQTLAPAQSSGTGAGGPGGPQPGEAIGTYSRAGSAKAADIGIPGQPMPNQPNLLVTPEPSVIDRLTGGVKQGYEQGVLTPQAQGYVEGIPVVGPLLGVVSRDVGAGLGGVGALYGEAQRAVAGGANALIPPNSGGAIGPSLAAGLDVLPALGPTPAPGAGWYLRNAATDSIRGRLAPLSPEFRANPLAPGAAERIAVQPSGDVSPTGLPAPRMPPAGTGAPMPPEAAPRSAGAMGSPAAAARLTPEEAALYRSPAELQKLTEPQAIGIPDRRALVPGENPTLAEMEQKVETAREQKALSIAQPAVSETERQVAEANNEARTSFLNQLTGSDVDLAAARKARDETMAINLADAWKDKSDANAQPVVDAINRVLAGPDGKRDAVVRQLNAIKAKLYNTDGNLERDPELLYGVRKDINDRLSKEAAREDPMSQRAASILIGLRDQALDPVIEDAAPGFGRALEQYRADSRPIDTMEVLQDRAPKLYDTRGKLLYSRVQQMMRDAVVSRRADAPLNQWQSVPDETMQKLWDLRDSLRRSASAEDLMRARGSDTVPNMLDVAKQYAKLGGTTMVHGIANLISPGWGSMILGGLQRGTAPIRASMLARRQLQRGMEMVRPPNALIPPDQAP